MRDKRTQVWRVVVLSIVVSALSETEDSSTSCTQLDFDEATLSSLRKCEYTQEFIVKRYEESNQFGPFRPDAVYYLSNLWQGLTCGETVDTYSFNEETELRMAYNLVFDIGATLEVRVFDEDRVDSDNKPTLVEVWHTVTSTDGWGMFREKLNKTVKKARIQIEANINAGSELAIEYLTIFNYEVETEECSIIDEFATTTEPPSSTETVTSSTTIETTPHLPVTTTTLETTMTTTTTETFSTTVLSTDEEETSTTAETSVEQTTTTTSETAGTTTTTADLLSTTTTNAPRDDTSIQPSTSTTQQATYSTTQLTHSPSPTTIYTTTENAPSIVNPLNRKVWFWMTMTAVFAVLFVLTSSVAIYLCLINRHLQRITTRLLDDITHSHPYKKT
uniref:Uncharacterized protein n=1 Tax=Anopheles culicifacies TaxID=139723 RepID=A0A182MUG5_9DIPT